MYHTQSHSGGSPELWEDNWRVGQFNEVLRFCTIDPLRPLFEKYSKPGIRMLEGGCGMGQYVTFYDAMGLNVIGLDFAAEALNRLSERVPHLKLCEGDVSALPFADNVFDLYYSGGVVEHFEGGAEESLLEACRVIKKKGIGLISVPYSSPLRSVLKIFNRNEWKNVSSTIAYEKHPDGLNFFQYAYKKQEFTNMLENAGFRVLETQGYAVMWGLYELPFMSKLNAEIDSTYGKGSNTEKSDQKIINETILKPDLEKPLLSITKRLAVSEDTTVPVLGTGVKFLRWMSANMMMYVCIKD